MAGRHGLNREHEQPSQALLRDTRSLGQKVGDFVARPANVALCLVVLAGTALCLPAVADVSLLLGAGLFGMTLYRQQTATLPFRMPLYAHLSDAGDPAPGTTKPRPARGIAYFGNDLDTGEELWLSNDDLRTHTLLFGSTGAGKTETITSLAFNALCWGSGFIYVDGKGDNSLVAKVMAMARYLGREDDVLVINYMTGSRDIDPSQPQPDKLSNTTNPVARGSSDSLTQLLASLMDDSGGGKDDMWKNRALNLLSSLMMLACFLRDRGFDEEERPFLLDVAAIRDLMVLDRLIDLWMKAGDLQHPFTLPRHIGEALTAYLVSLPGFKDPRGAPPDKPVKQSQTTLDQHGYLQMQFTKTLGSLADQYGHIFRTVQGEVDFYDVVVNRRILVVLLPALEKSPTELANLGKIILASLKNMMATGLGARLEGAYQQVVKSKPTNSPTPVLCAMDEVGYYAVPGLDVMAAQARSLGFWLLFAGQDIPALEKAGKEQAASIGANTNIKGCGKLEDAERTWQFFKENAGEAHVTHVSGFSAGAAELTNTYSDMANAAVEKRTRIDLRDLKEQREGEFHLFFKSRIVRARMFYAAPEEPKELRLNHFIKVQPPADEALAALAGLPETAEAIAEAVRQLAAGAESPVIADLAAAWQRLACATSPVERSMATFMEYAQARRRQSQATLAAMNRLGDAFLAKLNGITGPEPAADQAAAAQGPEATEQAPAPGNQSAGLGPELEEDDLPPGARVQNSAAVASASEAGEDSAGSGVESTDAKGDSDEAGESEAGATGSAGLGQAAPASGSEAPTASTVVSLASRLAQSSAVLSVARALSQGATVESAVHAAGQAGPPVKGDLLNQMADIERLAGNASGARATAERAYAAVEAALRSTRRPKMKAPPELVRLLEELDAGLHRSGEASGEGTNT